MSATVLNINKGHNEELMDKCKSLREYAIYVDKVRCYSKKMPMSEAVENAIEECIKDDVLADYLRKHKEEVKHMSIYEFNQELYDEGLREEGREEGRSIQQILLIRKKIMNSKPLEIIAEELECKPEEIHQLYDMLLKCEMEESNEEIVERLLKA